jgi:hypothetical protein
LERDEEGTRSKKRPGEPRDRNERRGRREPDRERQTETERERERESGGDGRGGVKGGSGGSERAR